MNTEPVRAIKSLFAVLLLVIIISNEAFAEFGADKIYINGKIITVDSANSIAQAIAVKDGKVLAVGTTASIKKFRGKSTVVVDLGGKTMMPGFIDGHSHIMGLGTTYAGLEPPPVGKVKRMADIVKVLSEYKDKKGLKNGDWIVGFGYDQDQMMEKRHPLKEDLDSAFPDNPVVISHISGHMVVANSRALMVSGIDSTTPDPAGGKIVRKPGTKEPAGLLQENAGGLLKRPTNAHLSIEDKLAALRDVQTMYASYGVTTAQDGYSSKESLNLLNIAAAKKSLFIDLECLASVTLIDSMLKAGFKFLTFNNHFKVAGFKMVADGSPQGKTAYFSQPYLTDVPGCSDHCTGIPTVTQSYFDAAVKMGFQNNVRVFVHCNGDATVDMYIAAVEKAARELGISPLQKDLRPVIIHSQFVRPDQLDKYKALGMLPAMFSNHAFFWGDVHVKNLGAQRAYFLSPLKTAIAKGIIATNHTDFPVTPINQMFLLWTSVERKSRSGEVIGPDERLTPAEGLRAITINGAYEYGEEKIKGSLEKGKLADMVILSADPLTIPAAAIKEISVLETIKEGITVFKR